MKILIEIPEEWFEDMIREKFKKTDELCAIIQHSQIIDDSEEN